MKRFRVLTAALCAAVLLCGFSVPAYAYAGGEGEDYGDPTMETPAPEPTITPGEGFDQEGNLVTRDLLYDEHTNKQFITVQTSGGNTFTLSLIMTSLWTRKANSMKPTFSALWMRGSAGRSRGRWRGTGGLLLSGEMCGGGCQYRLPGMLCQYGEMRRRRARAEPARSLSRNPRNRATPG